jgi:hypothetical protein
MIGGELARAAEIGLSFRPAMHPAAAQCALRQSVGVLLHREKFRQGGVFFRPVAFGAMEPRDALEDAHVPRIRGHGFRPRFQRRDAVLLLLGDVAG